MTSQGVGPKGPEAVHAPGLSPALLGAARARPSRRAPTWGLLLALLLLLHLTHPRTWGVAGPALWFPSAGIGLALVAWFGVRLAFPVLLASGLLVLVQAALLDALGVRGVVPGELAFLLADAALTSVELSLAWWLYQRHGGGAVYLSDPRSATLFLFLVPGVVAGLFAGARAVLVGWLEAPLPAPFTGAGLGQRLALCWLPHALGELILAPPLLVLATPFLLRHGLIRPGRAVAHNLLPLTGQLGRRPPDQAARRTDWGDWVEIVGLCLGASVLCLLLTRLHGQRPQLGWQLWGAPLLLIVWASIRQGPRGGILAASAAATFPLLFLPVSAYRHDNPIFAFLLQGHLLAQSSAALLVAGSIVWLRLRESSYRQVVTHVPVVIYSARLFGKEEQGKDSGPTSLPFPLRGAEVTLVSAASGALLGGPPEELLGEYSHWLARVHPDDREVVLAALAQLTRQEQPVTCEYRLAPGHAPAVRWLRDILAPNRDASGQLTGWEGVVTDVTEQRALADDLRRTTSMFNALIVNLPTGVFFVQGPSGKPILVNARARHLLGQREDSSAALEHLPQAYRLFRADGTLYPVEELPVYQALRNGRTTMRDDIVVHRPDGRHMPLVSWAAPVNLGGKGQDTAVWVLEDRTALHQAEAARLDTEGRLRAVIETMAEALIVQDKKGTIVEGNPSACELFGLPFDRPRAGQDGPGLRGSSPFDLPWELVREDGTPLPRQEHPAEVALRTGRPVRNVVVGLRPVAPAGGQADGAVSQRWVLVNAMPLGKGNGAGRQAAGVVTTFADMSAYVRARGAIRASEESYRGLVESLPVMVINADRDGRVVYTNPTTREITGYDMEEIADPATWAAVISPDDLPQVQAIRMNALAGQCGRAEARYRAKDGSDKTCYILTQPRYENNTVVGTLSLLVDVTRERQLERELARAQRLELVGRLSSGVAHDFNNMLTVVLSLADLARGHLPPEHPVHADLRRITEAGEQAASLAGQLLSLSKQQPVPARRIERNGVVRRTLELLRATLPPNLEVQAELSEEGLYLCADETQVQQVVMNLCLNARDAMPEGGRLQVRTARGTTPEGPPCVRLSVCDTGQGISEQVKGRLFEPFFTTKESGTGLGLAVVQQIVESNGGRVEAHSRAGEGASFEVSWPAAGQGLAE